MGPTGYRPTPMTDGETSEPITLGWLLDLQQIDRDLYVAPSPSYTHRPNLFGGQVSAQCLWAAALSVDPPHLPHSFHLYFLRAGIVGQPVVLYVDRIRDGRSFTTRTVVARQNGEAILTMSASFHKIEEGELDHQLLMAGIPVPDLPRGESQPGNPDAGYAPMDVVPVVAEQPGVDRCWMRMHDQLDDDPIVHACALAYMSDTRTGHAPMTAIGEPGYGRIQMTSLDHALHFHRHVRADDWVLFDYDAASVGRGRGLTRATIHSAGGVLGATLEQELLMRELSDEAAAARGNAPWPQEQGPG
jgi:acyl-CoA thioesterase II